MQSIKLVDPNEATGAAKEVFNAAEQRLGRVPNMLRVLGHSPAILQSYLAMSEAFRKAQISPQLRGLVTTAVAEAAGSDYMLSLAYSFGPAEGLTPEELDAARRAESADAKTAAALEYAVDAVRKNGHVDEPALEKLRAAGFSETEIAEIVALIALNLFRSYVNLLAGTEVDHPLVRTGRSAKAESVAA